MHAAASLISDKFKKRCFTKYYCSVVLYVLLKKIKTESHDGPRFISEIILPAYLGPVVPYQPIAWTYKEIMQNGLCGNGGGRGIHEHNEEI